MAAHGFDRATRDLYLFVPPDADNVARLRRALSNVFDDPDIATITADDLGGHAGDALPHETGHRPTPRS